MVKLRSFSFRADGAGTVYGQKKGWDGYDNDDNNNSMDSINEWTSLELFAS